MKTLAAVHLLSACLPDPRLWLVGGINRALIRRTPEVDDVDLCWEGNLGDLQNFLDQQGFGERTDHPKFGTAMFSVEGLNVEITIARSESYEEESRKPSIAPGSLEEDARRRDFTINAIYRQLIRPSVVFDPLNGQEHLRLGLLAPAGHPGLMLSDDPLRILRAYRFAAFLNLKIVQSLQEAIDENLPRLTIVSSERFCQELKLWFKRGPACYTAWNMALSALGIISEAEPTILRPIPSMEPIASRTNSWLVRAAVCFHSLNWAVADILNKFKFSKEESGSIEMIANTILLPTLQRHRRAIYNLDMAQNEFPGVDFRHEAWQSELYARNLLLDCPPGMFRSPLNGEQIMHHLNLEQGAMVGAIIKHLVNEVIEDRLQPGDEVWAVKLAKEFHNRKSK